MKHKVRISVSDKPQTGGIVTCRNVTIRDRLLRFLLGDKSKVTVLIPKDDTETVDAINAAIDAAIEEGIAKFGGKKPNKKAIKLPLRDGDEERDDESLKLFDKLYDKMTDLEKKRFVHTFIESIELYPDKQRKNGSPIKKVHFKFPVAYNGETVYDFSPPKSNNEETVVLMSRKDT